MFQDDSRLWVKSGNIVPMRFLGLKPSCSHAICGNRAERTFPDQPLIDISQDAENGVSHTTNRLALSAASPAEAQHIFS